MPRLPNFLIHLSAFVRPERLRPDLKVPSIAHVDFHALRRTGFNAVVIDKDNCVTWPEVDHVYPPLQAAWNDLIAAFPAGRVLVVSNSAGTKKDPGGIAAESVSLQLRAPVLIRSTPKPGCAKEILDYFSGRLGQPTTLRGRLEEAEDEVMRREKEEEAELLSQWLDKIDKEPILGPLVDSKGNRVEVKEEKHLESRMVSKQLEASNDKAKEAPTAVEEQAGHDAAVEQLRILVVGDRLFTDTLLARRLSLALPPSSDPARPSVISIHTTTLPNPKDVRVLRWMEEKLSKGRIKQGPVDWGRYTRAPVADSVTMVEPARSGLFDKIRSWRIWRTAAFLRRVRDRFRPRKKDIQAEEGDKVVEVTLKPSLLRRIASWTRHRLVETYRHLRKPQTKLE